MKTISVEPSAIETAFAWMHAHPVAALSLSVAFLFLVCLDRDTRRAFLPF